MATRESTAAPRPASFAVTREARALELYRTHGRKIVRLAENVYRVPSQDGERSYDVVYGGEREECACPDHQYRRGSAACVHLLAVGIRHATRRGGVREVRDVNVAGGDGFKASGGRRLREALDRYRHELLDDAERMELQDRINLIRRSQRRRRAPGG